MTPYAVARLPREIVFGKGQSAATGTIAARHGSRALVCTDERFTTTDAFEQIMGLLKASSLAVDVFAAVQPDVPYENVVRCVEHARTFSPDVVIGIGGGSCLDMAKCASLLLSHGGELRDYYGEFKVPGPALPVIAIPTTAGTGSEVTPVAVISDSSRTLKVGISSPYLIPAAAICDPEDNLPCGRRTRHFQNKGDRSIAPENVAYHRLAIGSTLVSSSYASCVDRIVDE
jgi:alcohol dehydrogenase